MKIVVFPEKLQELGREFENSANKVASIENSLRQAVANLDWETRRKANVEGSIRSMQNLSSDLRGESKDMSRFLSTKGQAFLDADRQGFKGVLPSNIYEWLPALGWFPGNAIMRWLGNKEDAFQFVTKLAFPFALAVSGGLAAQGLMESMKTYGMDAKPLYRCLGHNPAMGYLADPVNTGIGNFVHYSDDLMILGIGPLLHITRTYNSVSPADGPFGYGWTFSYGMRLEIEEGEASVTCIGDDGGHIEYIKNSNEYRKPRASCPDLIKVGKREYVLKESDGTVYYFAHTGKLKEVKDRNGNSLVLTYDSDGNIEVITAASGRYLELQYRGNHIIGMEDNVGRIWEYSYDEQGNLTEFKDACGSVKRYKYDDAHRLIIIVDGNGNTLVRNYYFGNRVIAQKDALGNTTYYKYFLPENEVVVTDPSGNEEVHVYDEEMRLVEELDSQRRARKYTYDEVDNLKAFTDRNGNEVNYAYIQNSKVSSVTTPLSRAELSYDNSYLSSVVDALGNETKYEHNDKGNLTAIIDPCGARTVFEYNEYGNMISVIDSIGRSMQFTYNGCGDRIERTDASSQVTRFEYDGIGRIIGITDPNSCATSYRYDNCDRLLEWTDSLGQKKEYFYDKEGNITGEKNQKGEYTKYGYNEKNELIEVVDALGGAVRYDYDRIGNLVAITDANNSKTQFEYKGKDRLAAEIDPLGNEKQFSYDAEGRIEKIIKASRETIDYRYDAEGNLVGIECSDGEKTTFVYDKTGRRIQMEDSSGKTIYEYDRCGRLLSAKYPDAKEVAYSYDITGRIKSIIYPDNSATCYEYDRSGRLSQIVDPRGQKTLYEYDAGGRLTRILNPNGIITEYDYDNANRLKKLVLNGPEGEVIDSYEFTYDRAGNRIAIKHVEDLIRCKYDALDRLIEVDYANGAVQKFEYDPMGNRVILEDSESGRMAYAYNDAHQLVEAKGNQYFYDENGNLVKKIEEGKETLYYFDCMNRLREVKTPQQVMRFEYNGDGIRTSKEVGKHKINYHYNVNEAFPRVLQKESEGLMSKFVYGHILISRISQDGEASFYHTDGMHSICRMTDEKANDIHKYSYSIFGDPGDHSEDIIDEEKYCGELFDAESKLIYLRTRYYEPGSGRFISKDPFQGYMKSSQSINPYIYCGNNPVTRIDPKGTSWWDDACQMGRDIKGGLGVVGDLFSGRQDIHELSPYWTESVHESLGIVRKGIGPLTYFPPVGFAMAWVDSMTNSYLYYYGEVSTQEFLHAQGWDVLEMFTFMVGGSEFKWGPGRPPKLILKNGNIGSKFFFGTRAQKLYKEVGKHIVKKRTKDFLREITDPSKQQK